MTKARDLARLSPNTSGLLPNANIEAVAASKLTGQVPDANAPSGSVIQVVQAHITTGTATTSQSYVDTAITASITPISSSNKILVLISHNYYIARNGVGLPYGDCFFRLMRGGSDLASNRYAINFGDTNWNDFFNHNSFNYLDSPNTTSSITYRVQMRSGASSYNLACPSEGFGGIALLEIAA
jgi:hypothetical protein